MKKLLALMLVLGITAVANADVIMLSVNGSTAIDEISVCPQGKVVIDVYSTLNDYGYECFVGNDDGTGWEWTSNNTIYAAAGGGASISYYGDFWWDAIAFPSTPDPTVQPIIAGRHFDFELECDAPGDVVIILQNTAGENVDFVTIHQVPEPASMLLLGLGGLLLRRRK